MSLTEAQKSNLKVLQKELVWLEEIIKFRFEFLEGTDFKKVHYKPVDFTFTYPGDKEIYVENKGFVYMSAKVREYRDEYLYEEVRQEKLFYRALTDQPIRFIEREGDWVVVSGKLYKLAKPDTEAHFETHGYKEFMVPLNHTNIPEEYDSDITAEELETYKGRWSTYVYTLIKHNIALQKKVKYWDDFYERKNIFAHLPPSLLGQEGAFYAQCVQERGLGFRDRFLLILSLAVHLKPDFFRPFYEKYMHKYPDMGGIEGQDFKIFMPTGASFLFFLSGGRISTHYELLHWLRHESKVLKENMVVIHANKSELPIFSGSLSFHPEWVERILNLGV